MSLQLKTSQRDIYTQTMKIGVSETNKDASKKKSAVERAVKREVRIAISRSPAIQALRDGILKADFGLTIDPGPQIVNSVVESTSVTYKTLTKSGNKILGGYTITVQPSDYSNLYGLGVSKQSIEGGELPWLNWLLEAGDKILIVDFGVEYGEFGRTGMAHMTEESRPFKVNSTYAGTQSDNFITKALQTNQIQITNAIIKALS